jgi:hypothetical protein
MEATRSETPPELVFPPQVPFSWTLRGARARRIKAEEARRIKAEEAKAQAVPYRIAGTAGNAMALAAAISFSDTYDATLELG